MNPIIPDFDSKNSSQIWTKFLLSEHSASWRQISFISFNAKCGAPISHPIKLNWMHSVFIRTVSSYCLLSALLFWFKLVYEPFGQSTMHLISARKESNETHHLEISYYFNFLGHLDSNGFQLKRRFGTHGN